MKKALIFFTDSIVFSVFVGLVVLTFVVTNSLSPVLVNQDANEVSYLDDEVGSDLNYDYVQVSNNLDNLTGEFRFENIFVSNEDISFASEFQDGVYLINLDLNNLRKREKLDLVKIINPTNSQYDIKIEVLGPLNDINSITTNLIVNEERIEVSRGVLRYTLRSSEKTSINVSLEFIPDIPINYSFEILVKFTIV